jgi:hypothetical protein
MTSQEITDTLKALFGQAVEASEPESWQVQSDSVRLLVLLSIVAAIAGLNCPSPRSASLPRAITRSQL